MIPITRSRAACREGGSLSSVGRDSYSPAPGSVPQPWGHVPTLKFPKWRLGMAVTSTSSLHDHGGSGGAEGRRGLDPRSRIGGSPPTSWTGRMEESNMCSPAPLRTSHQGTSDQSGGGWVADVCGKYRWCQLRFDSAHHSSPTRSSSHVRRRKTYAFERNVTARVR